MSDKKFFYTETFYSAQGEGKYIGIPSLWMRFFLCNLSCGGFGQEEPTKPDTWDLPWQTIDLTDITSYEQLPVFEKACDSAYSVSKRFKHLANQKTASEAVDELTSLLPGGKFKHHLTSNESHMVFTGGEPMINQQAMVDILREFTERDNMPRFVTVETNGTKKIKQELIDFIKEYRNKGGEWFWSISPKLWATAGEKPEKAIKPDVVGEYYNISPEGQLKYVVNGSAESWSEVVHNTNLFRSEGCQFPVWIMGVGGTLEGLKVTESMIADQSLERGYNYSTRAHVHIYGNLIGR